MPNRLDKGLFLTGLAIYTAGQLVITLLRGRLQEQTPIDYAHWLLLIGVVLLIPYTARLPRRGVELVASPVLVFGIVGVIGMCMIDFVFWALPPGDLGNEVFDVLRAEPSLWDAFMIIGANHIFMSGLLLAGLAYFRTAPIGAALVGFSAVAIFFTPQSFNWPLYSVMVVGYFLCFNRLRRAP